MTEVQIIAEVVAGRKLSASKAFRDKYGASLLASKLLIDAVAGAVQKLDPAAVPQLDRAHEQLRIQQGEIESLKDELARANNRIKLAQADVDRAAHNARLLRALAVLASDAG